MTRVRVTTTRHAASIATGIRTPASLVVRSVHRSAINLTAADGALVTIADARAGGLPGGILVGPETGEPEAGGLELRALDPTRRDPRTLDLRASGVTPGMAASLTTERCAVDGAGFVVELAGAARWSPRIAPRSPDPWPRRAAEVHAMARAASTPGGIAGLPVARDALERLGIAIAAGDRFAGITAAQQLVGLGPGLTPSGDDALSGVAAALHAVAHPATTWFTAALGDLGDLDARTTFVAAAMLRYAVRGDVAERTHRLLAALLAPSDDGDASTSAAIASAVHDTVAWGATSGSDLLAGVLVGLDAAAGRTLAVAA